MYQFRAVIGTFVLGLGDSLEQAPQAQLDAEVTGADGSETLDISHNGGDSIVAADIRVVVESAGSDFTETDFSGLGDDEFNVGETLQITTDQDGEQRVRVIHTPSESILLDTEVTFPSP